MDPNERERSSASRRFAGQMESIVQGVTQRAIELVVETVDVNALLARVDLNAVLARVELNSLLGRVDINQVLDRVDINQVLDRVDLDRCMARVDINEIVDRIDVEALVANSVGAHMAGAAGTVASDAAEVDDATRQAIADLHECYSRANTMARLMWANRLRRNHTGSPEPPNEASNNPAGS